MKEFYNCFVGLPLGLELKPDMDNIQKAIQKNVPAASIVEPHNAHLTLYYLGKQSEKTLKEIAYLLNDEKDILKNDKLIIGGQGIFHKKSASTTYPYVLYLKIEYSDKFHTFREHLGSHLSLYNKEERPVFIPHITLARLKTTEARNQFEVYASDFKERISDIKWEMSIREIIIYGKSSLHSPKFQDTLFTIPII